MAIVLPLKVEAGRPVLRGFDFLWATIRAAGERGRHFTSREIDQAGNIPHRGSASDFLERLVKAGIAIHVGFAEPPHRNLKPARVYQLVKRPAETPRVRRDGTQLPASGQERMWSAMRALGTFSAREVAVTASLETAPVGIDTARQYLKVLAATGYLLAVKAGGPNRLTVWRLKPSMNTGPKPPLILRSKIVWDANRGAVMGPVVAEEVAS